MGSIAAVPHKPSAQSIETRQPHDRNHEAQVVLPVEAADWQRGSGLRLDVLSKLQALRFSHLGTNLLAWCKGDEGEDIAEYAVMLAVILVIVVGTVRLIGSNANNVFSNVGSSIQ